MLRKLRAFQAFAPNKISSPEQENSEYVNLAPTDKADQSGIYSTALMRAAKDPDVFNIALTGPYGSGKSSIIKTFLKQYTKTRFAKKRVLQISLAAFLPEADLAGGHVSKQEIERSILQQMLYGADANDLPLSRFKRIQAPKFWSPFVSLFIIAGSVSFWYLLQQRRAILDGSFFQPFDLTNWIRLGCFAIGFTFVWRLLHQIYVKSFGFSLKSISFKDIEIIPEASREESILNRHLDEIIYFFQSTKYDLVVIEDLDRFNNPDIFVTLREINSLVNANVGVRRHIRFLYALRDNMFSNTDRTKFFEFIVPVIPIINSSNSIDKVLEQGERLSLGTRLDGQFLKEVSRYLNDMRLIRNIFNEYAIYIKNLEADEENVLNPNKLLAILIYKNVLPSDFEELHREKGKLSYILRNQDSMITNAEIVYKSKISEIEQQIGEAEKQVPADLSELCMIYAMALISKIPQGYIFVEFNGNQRIPIQSLWSSEEFEQIVESENILCLTANSQRTRVSLAGFQEELCATRRFADRKRDIQVKSQLFKEKSSKTIRELRSKLATLRTTKFNEIMRMDAKSTEGLFETFGETKELVKFLVLEGFLDDTYYQYTSLFHSGRLSPNDNKFLIQIRAHTNPDPDFQIDNPKEVISAMREDDFVQNFALNVILVDFMLGDENKYRQKIVALLEFISDNFEKCSTFFSAFYSRGKRLPEFTSRLIEAWPGFVSVALASSENITHAARLIAHLPEKNLTSLHHSDDEICEFLSEHLSEILALGVDFAPERIKFLPFEARDLKSIEPYPAVARLLADGGLYTVSIENIEFVFRNVFGLPAAEGLQTQHYSTVLRSGHPALIDKVEGNFGAYLTNILLALESNVAEDISTIIRVLNHDEIEAEHLESFLKRQSIRLPLIGDIPSRFHASTFRLQKIVPSWENCLAFLNSENFDAATLTDFLGEKHNRDALCSNIINGDQAALPLRQFVLNNNDLQEDAYRAYVRALPNKFNAFPDEIDAEKLLVLIEEEKVTFSESAFSALADYPDNQVSFIVTNIELFLANRDRFAIDDDFRDKLLDAAITDAQRLQITHDMDLTSLGGLPSRASTIGELYYRTGADISGLSDAAAHAIIINTEPVAVQIALFNRCQQLLTDDQVRQVLHELPDPFPDFKPGWRQPTLTKTEVNVTLVEWLVTRKIISSWKESLFGDIRVYNFRD